MHAILPQTFRQPSNAIIDSFFFLLLRDKLDQWHGPYLPTITSKPYNACHPTPSL